VTRTKPTKKPAGSGRATRTSAIQSYKKPKKKKAKSGPQITLKIDGNSTTYDPAAVTEDVLAELREVTASKPDTVVGITICRLMASSLPEQEAVWRCLSEITNRCPKHTLVVDGRPTADVVGTVIEMIVGVDDPRHEASVRAATMAASICCGTATAKEVAATRITDRLKNLRTPVRRSAVVADIRALSGASSDKKDGPNATLLAEDFVESQRSLLATDRPLNYFNGEFYRWNQVWRSVSKEEFNACVNKFLQASSEVEAVTQKLTNDVVGNIAGQSVLTCDGTSMPFYVDKYDPSVIVRRRHMLVMRNGLVDLDPIVDGEPPQLQAFDSSWFVTTQLPYDFDPKARCPRFLQFLHRVLEINPETGVPKRKDDLRLAILQEFFGYCLLTDGRFHKFLIMTGQGANGKSVAQNVLIKMLGHENVSHQSLDQFHGTFALEPLLGKMANICGDLNELDAVAEGVIKRLTGDDRLTVNRKNRQAATMQPGVKLIFATNTLPRFTDKSSGMWRRLIAMPFDVVIPLEEQNEQLSSELEAELPGILNWAIEGLQRLLQDGFSECRVCRRVQEQHRHDCDPLAQFVDELVVKKEGARTNCKDLYKTYDDWCEESNRRPLSSGEFSRGITRLTKIKQKRDSVVDRTGTRPYFWPGLWVAGPNIPNPFDNAAHSKNGRPRTCVPTR
jgi:P4 family phage/plasmid primase-like protien